MITAGIDCGAKNTKTVILKDGEVIGKGMVLTGFDQEKAVEKALDIAIQDAGIVRDDIQRIGGTGSGKNAVKIADDDVNDIKAMSKGAIFFFPNARTVTDVGAEEGGGRPRSIKMEIRLILPSMKNARPAKTEKQDISKAIARFHGRPDRIARIVKEIH